MLNHTDGFCRWRCSDCALEFGNWRTVARDFLPLQWFCHSWMLASCCAWCHQSFCSWLCRWVHSHLCTWSRRGRFWSGWNVGTVACINVPYSTISRYHSIGLTMDPSKISHSNARAGGWRAWPEALSKCGLSTMTVSLHMFIAFIAAMNGRSARFHRAKPPTSAQEAVYRQKRAILWPWWTCACFLFGKPRNVCILKSSVLSNTNVVIVLLTILTRSDKNGSRRSQLDRM